MDLLPPIVTIKDENTISLWAAHTWLEQQLRSTAFTFFLYRSSKYGQSHTQLITPTKKMNSMTILGINCIFMDCDCKPEKW